MIIVPFIAQKYQSESVEKVYRKNLPIGSSPLKERDKKDNTYSKNIVPLKNEDSYPQYPSKREEEAYSSHHQSGGKIRYNQSKSKRLYSSVKNKKIRGALGKIYISSTKNNTILTLVDTKGNTKGWSCSGSLGFKNARKSTTYAAQAAAESIVKKAKILGYTHLRLLVKGLGRGKQSCLRAVSKSGLKIISLEDKTGIPYNGCRPSKKRRV